mgnify:CR=1 FL=1
MVLRKWDVFVLVAMQCIGECIKYVSAVYSV